MDNLNSLPSWIRVEPFDKHSYEQTLNLINRYNLNTVCIEANCPNRYQCFSKGTATFMILGDVCSRNCRYCNVKSGIPKPVDENEPHNLAKAVKEMSLDYAVITSVTRDDLEDGGAGYFVNVVKEIRKLSPYCKIELLIPDFQGSASAIKKVVDSKPDVINHNIEVVKGVFSNLRPAGNYNLSLSLLKKIKELDNTIITKSGFMLGLGESEEEILNTMKDLKRAGCDVLTIGQYLQPSNNHAPVNKYYTPEEFDKLRQKGLEMGFLSIQSGPLVRSSYRAKESYYEAKR